MQVTVKPLHDIFPYGKNARKIPQSAVDAVSNSLKEFGWQQPIVIDKNGVIVVGHVRRLAALQLGYTEAPCTVFDGTAAQARQYRLMDNRSHEEATWDPVILNLEMLELKALDLDLAMTGFSSRELDAMLRPPNANEDDAPPVPDTPFTQPGDLWTMEQHQLLCGDATDPEAVMRVCGGKNADLVFTSPPYLQQRQYNKGVGDWDALMRGIIAALPFHDGTQVLINLGLVHREGQWVAYWDAWLRWMEESGWRRFGWYVWDQGPGLPGDWNGRLAPSHEFIFHFNKTATKARKTKDCKWAGAENHGSGLRARNGEVSGYSDAGKSVQKHKIRDSVFRVMRHKARGIEVEHPAVFPVLLAREIIEAFSDSRQTVFEPMAGSGSTIIAAEETDRRCFGIEIDSRYCDVIVKRWMNLTGKQAYNQDGVCFPSD